MNQAFRELVSASAAATVAAARALASVSHSGLKGALRETLVRDFLLPLLPPQLAVGHGVVVTARNDQSTEQDVVVFNRSVVPPVLLDPQTGLFPLESVLYAVEVKSDRKDQRISANLKASWN
jgi:hypothetical protein